MATKCMSCGGSKMKKMKTGGASGLCPDGQYWSVQGCQDKTTKYKPPFSSPGAKAGIVTGILGTIGTAVKMISDKNKNKQAVKKAAEEAANTPVAKFTKKMDETLKTQRRGGTVNKKKYAMGGQTIVGMPGYNATTRPMQMKSGGATKNAKLAAVAPPRNKVTRADVLTRILKKKKK